MGTKLRNIINQKFSIKEIDNNIIDLFNNKEEFEFPVTMSLAKNEGRWTVIYKDRNVGYVDNWRGIYSDVVAKDMDENGEEKIYKISVLRQEISPDEEAVYIAVLESEINDLLDIYFEKGLFKLNLNDSFKLNMEIGSKLNANLDTETDSIKLSYFEEELGVIDTENMDSFTKNILENIKKKNLSNICFILVSKDPFMVYPKKIEIKKKTKEIEDYIKKISKEGIIDLKNAIDIFEYLEENEIPDTEIEEIFKSMTKYDEKEKKRIPKKPETPFIKQDKNELYKAVVSINENDNLLLEGHMSTGKNVLCETLAWIYNRPLYEFSMNSEIGNFELLGTKTIENGDIKFEESLIIEGFKKGGIIVFDELNTALPQVISIFNSMLDHRHKISVPGYNNNEPVEGSKNSVIIGTQNPNYIGTQDLNQATRSRFTVIKMSNVDSISRIINQNIKTPLDEEESEKMDSFYKAIMAKVEENELDETVLNIRGLIKAARMYKKNCYNYKDAVIEYMAENIADVDDNKIVNQIIEEVF